MKKILFSVLTIFAAQAVDAQSSFFTKTCYRGAFAPAPAAPWTQNWTEWDPQNKNYGAPTQTVSTNVQTNTTWSGVVLLQGPIYVKGNVILTITPGTIIRGSKAVAGTALIVTKGSQLIANGTESSPIVFTSDQAIGSRSSGDWGGIILLGKAAANYTSGINNVEGLPATADTEFGGGTSPDDNDNSGSLKYVRIEFGGYQYQLNQEINGLTCGAVGRGTTLDYIQSSFIFDDGFEWFGGTVNAKHLVSYRNLDDDFDTDNGFSGNVQFGLIVRDPALADNPAVSTSEGFESDNNAGGTATPNGPTTSAIFSNITMVGPMRGASTNTIAAGYRRAARIRRASTLRIFNSVFMDVQRGIHIDGSLSEAAATANILKFKHNIVAGTLAGKITEVNTGSTFNAPAWFAASSNDSIVYSNPAFNTILTSPYSFLAGDYRPAAGSPALSGASFTDATISAQTSTVMAELAVTVPSTVCIGSNSSVQAFTFTPSTTITPGYCSLSWSVSPGVVISSSTAVMPTFTVSTTGTFSVFLMVTNGDGSSSAMSAITTNTCLDVAVARQENTTGNISLFPNPAKNEFVLSVRSASESALTVRIFDMIGKEVSNTSGYSLQTGENKFAINVEDLANGVYIVSLDTKQSKETVKLIVNK